MGKPQEGHLTLWFSQRRHLQKASCHSYEEHQRALGDPLLNATYKLLNEPLQDPHSWCSRFPIAHSSTINSGFTWLLAPDPDTQMFALPLI